MQTKGVFIMCESCNAKAVVTVKSFACGLSLEFCKHHYEKNADGLMLGGFYVITDTRAELVSAK